MAWFRYKVLDRDGKEVLAEATTLEEANAMAKRVGGSVAAVIPEDKAQDMLALAESPPPKDDFSFESLGLDPDFWD